MSVNAAKSRKIRQTINDYNVYLLFSKAYVILFIFLINYKSETVKMTSLLANESLYLSTVNQPTVPGNPYES